MEEKSKLVKMVDDYTVVYDVIAEQHGADYAFLIGKLISYQTAYEGKGLTNKYHEFFYRREIIAKQLHISTRKVSNMLSDLIEWNFIRVYKRGKPAKNYFYVNINNIESYILKLKTCKNCTTKDSQEVQNMHDNNSIDNIDNNSKKEKLVYFCQKYAEPYFIRLEEYIDKTLPYILVDILVKVGHIDWFNCLHKIISYFLYKRTQYTMREYCISKDELSESIGDFFEFINSHEFDGGNYYEYFKDMIDVFLQNKSKASYRETLYWNHFCHPNMLEGMYAQVELYWVELNDLRETASYK